ncbi:MAG: peptidylprolyl isomerase [Oscillospiraceae bacterium]|nr:peptidylprolyl isomerase [Oscillospiraceae bacterium]
MKNRWIAGVLAFAAFTGMLTGCSKSTADSSAAETRAAGDVSAEQQGNAQDNAAESGGTFIITLHPEDAPISCENFEKLVKEGYYDGLTFHRVVEDFMAQGGDPTTGGKEQADSIKGEFISNGVQNDRKHLRGTVSMARTSDPNSASSQFFICYTECDYLDGAYAAFGEVTEGMEVVDDFLKVERVIGADGAQSAPTSPIIMEKVEMIDDDADGNHRVQVTMNNFLG